MAQLKRILVPTNLGKPSKAAIAYAVAFARAFDARLYLLRVLSMEDYETAIESERVVETLLPDQSRNVEPLPDEIVRNAARESLGGMLDAQGAQDVHVEYLLRGVDAGGPGAAIVACAREQGANLIIMGKHRLGLVEHMLAGSVTERVVKQSPCPIMIVQHPQHVLPEDPAGSET